MFPMDKSNSGGKKKPAFLRKSAAPVPPSDGAEDGAEMVGHVTCPKCGHAFDPDDETDESMAISDTDDSY